VESFELKSTFNDRNGMACTNKIWTKLACVKMSSTWVKSMQKNVVSMSKQHGKKRKKERLASS
jgi:hypothetical protein